MLTMVMEALALPTALPLALAAVPLALAALPTALPALALALPTNLLPPVLASLMNVWT